MNNFTLQIVAALLASPALVPAAAAQPETPKEAPNVRPIESLWLLTIPQFPGTSESDAALAKALKKWQSTGVFDAISLIDHPPTFVGEKDFTTAANALIKEAGGRFIITTLPVGKEGWESSANPRLAQKFMGTHYDADFFVWMDLEEESLQAGEPRWRETMGQVLDKILKLTPKEKTVIQWINNPRWPAKDPEGTKAYISVCQAKGINRFGMLCRPQGLFEREPWYEFYRALPKTGGRQ